MRYLGSFDEPWPGGGRIREELLDWLSRAQISALTGDRHREGDGITYTWRGVKCRMCSRERYEAALREEVAREPALVLSGQEESDRILQLAAGRGLHTAGWVHSISGVGMLCATVEQAEILCVSEFVRRRVRENLGREGLLFHPPFDPAGEAGTLIPGGALTMVNPIPEKGGELFVEIVERLPKSTFIAVDGWYPATLPALPNLRRFTRPALMPEIWRQTSTLLVPSPLEEGFGRVCVEAGQRRIPSITSGRGGLSEAAAGGGPVADPEEPSAWIAAIELLDDPAVYEEYAGAALRHARSFEGDPVHRLRELGVIN